MGTYWGIFDHDSRDHFCVGNTDWADRPKLAQRVLEDPALVQPADTLPELAEAAGLPAEAVIDAVARHKNALVETGENDAYGPFQREERTTFPRRVAEPPFYAVRFYLTAHKNMGGVSIDLGARALDDDGEPARGLYAAGEVSGSAGINGIAGLDGTFTGPAISIGRVARRTAAESGSTSVVLPDDDVDDNRPAGAPGGLWMCASSLPC